MQASRQQSHLRRRAPLESPEAGEHPEQAPARPDAAAPARPSPSAGAMAPQERIFVALGTNLGDRLLNLAEACRRLARVPRVTVRARSPVVQTPALLAPGDTRAQPDFLNCVVELRSSLSPEVLLEALLGVERAMGRVRGGRWGPRVIDLDLVLFGARVLETPSLTLPHPGLLTRRFVLEPLAALAPDLLHPTTGATVRELLRCVLRTSP